MALALTVNVKESAKEIRSLLKSCIPFLEPRLKLLLVLKKYDGQPISKRDLMELTGLCSASVHKWRKLYIEEGLAGLLSHNKTGFKPTILNEEQHQKLEAKLHNSENGIRGYKELREWVFDEFKIAISYNTLLKYCVKRFGSKIKVARKYHAKKDQEQVNTFKKTSIQSALKQ